MHTSFWKKLSLSTIALTAAITAAMPAHALGQFASFSIDSGKPFGYDKSTGLFTGTDIAGTFKFNVDTIYGAAGTTVDALFTIQASTIGVLDSDSDILANNLSLVAKDNDSSFGRIGTTLLSIAPTINSQGIFDFDTQFPQTVVFRGDTAGGDTIHYSSDVLDFSHVNQSVFNYGASDLTPDYVASVGQRPNSFHAGGTINFSSEALPTTSIPEANAGLLVSMALPVLGSIAVVRRVKK